REKQVLALVADGNQNKIIAGELQLSEHTIKLHMHHIFSKLGVTNRTQAAAIYRQPKNLGAS
ncbi:MAG: LuxR C-terminal-related transcriptional regulator, partial [Pseudomonadota bacterium]